jgi:uncharacterized protein (DUF1330 family)
MTQRNLFITVAFLLLLGSLSVKADTARPPAAPVYLILDITVHDTDTYAQYREKVEPVIENYGGRYVVRSGAKSFDNNPASAVISPEGEWYPDRIIVLEFKSKEQVQRFVESPEYQAIVHLRTSSASTKSVLVNGYQPPE